MAMKIRCSLVVLLLAVVHHGEVVVLADLPPSRSGHARAGTEEPGSRNLEEVASRIHSGRCNLLLIGDSIATSFILGDRGSWVTGIWRCWRPQAWRGRFIPAAMHAVRANGTTVANGGVGAAFDPACRRIFGNGPAHPGESDGIHFAAGGWGLLVDGFETLGDLEDRSLARFMIPSRVDGVGYWNRYGEDSSWAGGVLDARMLVMGTPTTVPRYGIRGRRSDDVWTETRFVDIQGELPSLGNRLIEIPFDFENVSNPSTSMGTLAVEIRTDPSHQEESGRSMMFLGCFLEQPARETGLMLGSHSVGGDTTGAHLADGDVLATNGSPVNRFYDDAYLREFIRAGEWNTFVLTLGTNDLNALQRSPAEAAAGVAAVVDRYRSICNEVRADDPSLLTPEFLIISPATAGSEERSKRFAAFDVALGKLAGDDVAVIHLHRLLTEQVGSWSDYRDQILTDVTHPDRTGSMLKAEITWNEIERVLDIPSKGGRGPLRLVPGEYPSVADAVADAGPDEVILIGPGTRSGGVFVGEGPLEIRSTHGRVQTVIDAAGEDRCLTVSVPAGASAIVRDLTLRGGAAEFGGGVRVESGGFVLDGSRIEDCHATASGGAIHGVAGDIEVLESVIDRCSAGADGGGVRSIDATLTIDSSAITRCTAAGDGGGISVRNATSALFDVRIDECSAHRGGGVHASGGELGIRESMIRLNSSVGSGGGIDVAAELQMIEGLVTGNSTDGIGGGIAIHGGQSAELSQLDMTENIAGDRGGAMAFTGDIQAEVSGCTFRFNQGDAGAGGVLLDCAGVTMSSCLFEFLDAPFCSACEVSCGSLSLAGNIFCPNADGICGTYVDLGGNEFPPDCDAVCAGDLNLDGLVDGGDLGAFFAAWGPCSPSSYCRPDLNRDGFVDGGDLGTLLGIFGDPSACD